MNLKIVIDDKIPFIRGVFEPYAKVVYAQGRSIDAAMVKDADALVIRTRTLCNADLLDGSDVKLIVTATIGFDHIDKEYCKNNNITWVSAPGCNADAVVQYVFSALGHLADSNHFDVRNKVMGIVGVGNVGGRIADFAERLGMKVLRNDPPREAVEGAEEFVSLEEIKRKADIITFHTPLVYDGQYPTYHLLGEDFFNSIKQKPIIINAARGEVCDNNVLKSVCKKGLISALILDCWENEPHIDADLLKLADVGTFHIAGYSMEGKANATTSAVRTLGEFFNLKLNNWSVVLPENNCLCTQYKDLVEQVMCSYPVFNDVNALKLSPDKFEELRGNYQFRRQPDCL